MAFRETHLTASFLVGAFARLSRHVHGQSGGHENDSIKTKLPPGPAETESATYPERAGK